MRFPKNAISMVGDIDRCWLFAYRVPLDQVAKLTPEPLEAVSHGGFGFLNIVISQLSHMRPLGLPAIVGVRYWHVAYRIPVRASRSGKGAVEGLYFLRSDADSTPMVGLGNLMTDFRFHKCQLITGNSPGHIELKVISSEAPAEVGIDLDRQPELADGSPFTTLDEAQAFLKYKPAGIVVNGGEVDVLRITRDESAWKSRLVHVDRAKFGFLGSFDATLEVCYQVEPIHYRWNRAERY